MSYQIVKLQGKRVWIVKPKDYKPSGKVIIHFHGLRNASWDEDKTPNTGEGTVKHYGFENILPSDTFMFHPIGNRSSYTLDNDWNSVRYLLPALADYGEPVKEVTISGHSAAGQVISPILRGGTGQLPVNRVFLFDALYSSDVSAYNEWLRRRPSNQMWSVSRDNDGVYGHSQRILGPNMHNIHGSGDHYKLVSTYMPKFFQGHV